MSTTIEEKSLGATHKGGERSPVVDVVPYAGRITKPGLTVMDTALAESLAQQNRVDHDAEVLAVATLLHDLALSPEFDGPLRFEVEAANTALNFAKREGLDARRAQLIWDGVALNSTPSIALYKETEVRLCTLGIGLDWGGFGYESLTKAQIDEVVDAFPRLKMQQ